MPDFVETLTPARRWITAGAVDAQRRRPPPAAGCGPRGSLLIPTDFDWHLLAGDETALPAIARRLEELPAGSRAFVALQTQDVHDQRELHSAANLKLQWLPTRTPGALAAAVAAISLPPGEGYAWACPRSRSAPRRTGSAARRAITRTWTAERKAQHTALRVSMGPLNCHVRTL
jgi:NADPH-dependent ferric siderophore reductase